MAPVVFFEFLCRGLDGFSCNEFSPRGISAYAYGELGWAGTALTEACKTLFDKPVLKGMEGDDCKPSADLERIKCFI